ncbi:hypothetical protein GGR57DRAFT_263503 [Xylariaceae sp. FL1272]|nr:hypothetical protein GGR57DRAFT_263503 [Xylariaceae sp. FL1272]
MFCPVSFCASMFLASPANLGRVLSFSSQETTETQKTWQGVGYYAHSCRRPGGNPSRRRSPNGCPAEDKGWGQERIDVVLYMYR